MDEADELQQRKDEVWVRLFEVGSAANIVNNKDALVAVAVIHQSILQSSDMLQSSDILRSPKVIHSSGPLPPGSWSGPHDWSIPVCVEATGAAVIKTAAEEARRRRFLSVKCILHVL